MDRIDSAIEALGLQGTFEAALKATRGDRVSMVGYFGQVDYVHVP